MDSRNSKFWLGLGIGSIIGSLVYRFCQTSKAKKMKEDVCTALQKISGKTENMLDGAKEKVLDAGTAVVDRVADTTYNIAEKADDLKGKVHSYASDTKK